jgi:ubiquinone/menaquinone biosynthesis C-methylase UbiE
MENSSVDVVISNCVINLCPNKNQAFKEIFRVLKSKCRLLISDLVTKEDLPQKIRNSFDAWSGCIAGALQKNENLKNIRDIDFQK